MHAAGYAVRMSVRRIFFVSSILASSAAIAAGCGSSDNAERADEATSGALRLLPAQTWVVGTADLSSARLDRAVDTLDRLPVWGLVEPELPASDGKGLRRALLEQIARELADDGKEHVTAKQLEAAFGNHVGFAITSGKSLDELDANDPPVAVWIDVDDEARALDAMAAMLTGKETKHEHEGVTYFATHDDAAAYAVIDDLLVASSSSKQLERLIDAHEGDEDDTLSGASAAKSVLGASVGEPLLTAVVQTDPLLAMGNATGADELTPDWIGASATIDDSGLRMRTTWSNPHALAKPDPTSRELVERMPATTSLAQATAASGSELQRVQHAWANVREEANLDLDTLFDDACAPGNEAICTLGSELAHTVLEDESLADAIADAGATVSATSTPDSDSRGAKDAAIEIVGTHRSVDWKRPATLDAAMQAAGLQVDVASDGATTIRVRPASPLGRQVKDALADLPDESSIASILGVDPLQLLKPAGIVLTPRQVDELDVMTLPPGAKSLVTPALEGDVDTLADDADYDDAVKSAGPPKRTGSYGYLDIRGWARTLLTTLGEQDPSVARVQSLVDNNLADLPGVLWWTTREGSGDDQVGVAEFAMPIRD